MDTLSRGCRARHGDCARPKWEARDTHGRTLRGVFREWGEGRTCTGMGHQPLRQHETRRVSRGAAGSREAVATVNEHGPGQLNGRPVAVRVQAEVVFTLRS